MNERIAKLFANPLTIPLAVGIVSFGAGVGVGYFINKQRAGRMKIYGVSDLDEVEEPRLRPKPVVVDESYLASRDGQGLEPKVVVIDEPLEQIPQPEPEIEVIDENIFANNGSEWNLEEEFAKRAANPGEPYVVHKDEFFQPDEEHEGYLQHQLTYYAGDKILCDEDQKPVYDQRIVGNCLELFGHGSGDENVVFVRNDLNKAEYEIMLDPGHFAVEVQGLDDDDREFRHSSRNRLRD